MKLRVGTAWEQPMLQLHDALRQNKCTFFAQMKFNA